MAKNNDGKMSGNRGEWTELYVFLKLLAQGEIYAIKEKLNYPIVKIMREEQGEQIDYVIDKGEVVVEIQSREIMRIDRSEIGRQAKSLLDGIKKNKGENFELPEIEKFFNGIKVTQIKAPAETTTDISMQIYDEHKQSFCDLGFSIKSQIGEAATLLNASQATNFIYKVEGLTREQADEINAINGEDNKINRRMAKIREYGGELSFFRMNNNIFEKNLKKIDSSMPEIIAYMLRDFYENKGSNEGIKKCKELVSRVEKRNPLGYGDTARRKYADKFKELLGAKALGMQPAKPWDGFDEVNGGYIIAKKNGEILAYHTYYRNSFEQYLLDNTKLETASTSEKKNYKFMELYEENGEVLINLNLQIRFK